MIFKLVPLIVNDALSVLPAPLTKEYVKLLLASGSLEDKVPTVVLLATFSLILEAERAKSVGIVLVVSDTSSVIVTVRV